jgi:sulfane dehydrogenase subunit SoxC
VTPQRDLFVMAHLGIPRVDTDRWRLEIRGLVERPATLVANYRTSDGCRRVRSNPSINAPARRADPTSPHAGSPMSCGAALISPICCGRAAFVPRHGSHWAYGLDHGDHDEASAKWYVKYVPLTRLGEGGVLLAYAVNGEPLTPEHGFPLRLVVPGYYGTNAVKWLWRLELTEARAGGPFTTQLYNDRDPSTGGTRPVWAAPPEALIVVPAPGLLAAVPVEIWGWA